MAKKGLFIVFEGADGSGTSSQIPLLIKHLDSLDKYIDVLKTHEPTKKAKGILKILKSDKDAMSNSEKLARLYTEDRAQHTQNIITPSLKKGIFVISDRHKMSTCAYQWAQGLPIETLHEMHANKGILIPDITFYIDVPPKTAKTRIKQRGIKPDKFELGDFRDIMLKKYNDLVKQAQQNPRLFGKVVKIDGTKPIEKVSEAIIKEFDKAYNEWKSRSE